MASVWYYGGQSFNSEDSANSAVVDLKNILDNNPTNWVKVKPVTGDSINGWVIPGDDSLLTDDEINNISGDGLYSVTSKVIADNFVGLTAAEASTKVNDLRAPFAAWKNCDTITKAYSPTNHDMSVYLPSDSSN